MTLLEVLASDDGEIGEALEAREDEACLLANMYVLGDLEKEVIYRRYGLGKVSRQTQREIAKKMGISRSYVSRIEKRAIKKLLKEMTKNVK